MNGSQHFLSSNDDLRVESIGMQLRSSSGEGMSTKVLLMGRMYLKTGRVKTNKRHAAVCENNAEK